MVKLSVNINKIATLRNSRGGAMPDLAEATQVCIDAGAPSITVHPRADGRHIRREDVYTVAEVVRAHNARGNALVEYNMEGDARPDFIELVLEIAPHQCTLVPVRPGEITSEAGWPADTPREALSEIIAALHERDVRVSVFVDPESAPIEWAAALGADRIELYTEPYARAHEKGGRELATSLEQYVRAAELATRLGLGINAGHDLSLLNLEDFLVVPGLDEASIGHALISRAVFVGLDHVVREYVSLLDSK